MGLISLGLVWFSSLLVILSAQPEFRYNYCFDDKVNYTNNSIYKANLNTLLSNLTSNTEIDYGFYNLSYGQNSDRANAIGLCRGDVKPDYCRSCLDNSRVLLPLNCPVQGGAIGGYDECMLYYSNRSISGLVEPNFSIHMWSVENASDWNQYIQVVRDLLNKITNTAASGDSHRKFAVANATGPRSQNIYTSVQCKPDLSEQECSSCLTEAISEISQCCNGKLGGRVIKISCNFRFETNLFYEFSTDAPTPASTPTSTPPQNSAFPPPPPPPFVTTNTTSSQGKSETSKILIAIAVPIVANAIVVLLIFLCISRVRKSKKDSEDFREERIHTFRLLFQVRPKLTMTVNLLTQFNLRFASSKATNNFSNANKLGEGGFGPVYKGRLSNGQEVAIKRLSRTSGQGDNEFKNEVLLMAKLQRRNLVRLHGFCLEENERILVYEFLPNKSLDYFIFDPIKRAQLDWKRRFKIIEGVTRDLLYLHEDSQLQIIHRDLKVSNILLDAKMNSKISDFGMAKLFDVDQTHGKTAIIAGTYGYMAPEYAIYGKFSPKSDVFSFGVLLLEIISGRKNSGSHNENVEHLPSVAWKNWRQGTASKIVDPTLDIGSMNEIMRCIQIGLLCVQEKAVDRPTLASVLLMLEGHSVSLPVPSRPAFFMKNATLSETDIHSGTSSTLSSGSVDASRNELSITELYPR